MSWTTWDPSPFVLDGAAVALVLFAAGFAPATAPRAARPRELAARALFLPRSRSERSPLVSPLDEAGDTYLLSAHMLQHVVIGDVAPALVLVALRGPLVFFLLPRAVLRPLARRGRCEPRSRFSGARVSLAAWALVIGAWHIPGGLRLRARAPDGARPRAPLVRRRRAARVDADRRPRPPERAHACPDGSAARPGWPAFALALGGVLLLAAPLYPGLRAAGHAALRALAGRRPAARRARDDRRAARLVRARGRFPAVAAGPAATARSRRRLRRSFSPVPSREAGRS